MKKFLIYTLALIAILLLSGFVWWNTSDYQVFEDRPQRPMSEYVNLEGDFQKLFQLAQDGETIELPAGHFQFTKALILDGKNNITIKGAGMDKTVLSFRNQTEGAEGIRVANGHNITLEGFTVQDAIGDNIKAIYIDTLTFRSIKTEWTAEPNTELGAYGLYPVICKNVLIEECEALRGSDSGIYVGQSENIVIRNNKALENVCGINVENSGNVDIHGNECYHNAVGLTLLDIPGLTRYMKNVTVHHNKVYDNTLFNFAPAGNVAASSMAGTGILVWAGKNAHFYENEITGNPFPAMVASFLSSYELTKDKAYVPIAASEQARMKVGIEEETSLREDAINEEFKKDKTYNPYNQEIVFSNNTWSFGDFRKKLISSDGLMVTMAMMGKDAHIWYDGVMNPDGSTICINEKTNLDIVNMDMMNEFKAIGIEEQSFDCAAASLVSE